MGGEGSCFRWKSRQQVHGRAQRNPSTYVRDHCGARSDATAPVPPTTVAMTVRGVAVVQYSAGASSIQLQRHWPWPARGCQPTGQLTGATQRRRRKSVFVFREKLHVLGNLSAISFENLKTLFFGGTLAWESAAGVARASIAHWRSRRPRHAQLDGWIAESWVWLLSRRRSPASARPPLPLVLYDASSGPLESCSTSLPTARGLSQVPPPPPPPGRL
jgi:hypothetical protein